MLPAIIAALAPILLPQLAEAALGSSPSAEKIGAAAVDVVSAVTGVTINSPAAAKEAVALIQADPAKLAEAYRMQGEQVTALLTLDNQDRADARRREVELKDPTPSRLAYLILGGFLAYAFTIMLRGC